MLFNLYLNEIPFLLDGLNTGPLLLLDGSSINRFLYANDLVLISHSATGLQTALDTLSQFWKDWLLNIILEKKIVIFQKKLRKAILAKYHFHFNSDQIDIVSNYTYLGVKFSLNGNFSASKINLKRKRDGLSSQHVATSIFQNYRLTSLTKYSTPCFLLFLYRVQKFWESMTKMIITHWERM